MMNNKINGYYDKALFVPVIDEYYGSFGNYGYWYPSTRNQEEACINLLEVLLGFLPSRTGTILDVACGLGATTRYLSKYYDPANIVGVNISAKQLEHSRRLAPGSTFLLMDAALLDFDDNHFDAVLCVEASFHFNTREAFLREAYRVLKPGGQLLVADMMQYKLVMKWSKLFPVENYIPSAAAYRKLYERVGFCNVTVVDAMDECVRRRHRAWLRLANNALLVHKITARQFIQGVLGLHISRALVRGFLLASATKI